MLQMFGFAFGGVYDEVKPNGLISYTMDDSRKVKSILLHQAIKQKLQKFLKQKMKIQ